MLAGDKQQGATAAVAIVVIQAFDYMISKCVRYKYITGLVAHITYYSKEQDLNTLVFHRRIQGCTRLTGTCQFLTVLNVVSTVASFIFMASAGHSVCPETSPEAANVCVWLADVAALEHLAPLHVPP